MSEKMSRLRRPSDSVGALSCVSMIPALGADHKFDGVYTGKRSLTALPKKMRLSPSMAKHCHLPTVLYGIL